MEHVFSLPSLVVLLSLVAFVSSLLLLKSTMSGKSLPGCGPGSSCDEVTTSRWSRLGPIHTTVPGAALYLAMLAGAVIVAAASVPDSALSTRHSELARRAATSLGFCSLLAAGGAIWFTALQALVIQKFCRYCMVTHVSALAAAVLALRAEPPSQGISVAAAAVLGLFIIGQVAIVPRMYSITETTGEDEAAGTREDDSDEQAGPPVAAPEEPQTAAAAPPADHPGHAEASPSQTPATVSGGPQSVAAVVPREPAPATALPEPPAHAAAAPAGHPSRVEASPSRTAAAATPQIAAGVAPVPAAEKPPRRIHAMGKKVSLSPHLWPMLGDRNAAHIIIDQLDYTCHFCRDVHKLLMKAIQARRAELAVLIMPVPMDMACNPMVKATPAEHRDACVYARYAMGVFRAAPERFAEMDEWLFEPIRPWELDLVKMRAEFLAGGADKLAAAMNDPWMAKRHNEAMAIYDAAGQGQLPKMLFEHAAVSGPIPSYEQLLEVFEKVQLFNPQPANPQ
ncbi:MAG: vitamin K epoxide reductase family protein [Tepidisphaeraceae bacterium]